MIALFILVLMSSLVIAAGNQSRDINVNDVKGQGQESGNDSALTGKAGDGLREIKQERVNVSEEVRQKVIERQQEIDQELKGMSVNEQKVFSNQNAVMLAVHALLALENRTGGIGPQISAIAKEFNNSVKSTLDAETKVENRSSFARFFAGGDKKAALEIEEKVKQNKVMIQQLKNLKEQYSGSDDVKELMQQQILTMESEQDRLTQLADKEKNSKGMFGWLWK